MTSGENVFVFVAASKTERFTLRLCIFVEMGDTTCSKQKNKVGGVCSSHRPPWFGGKLYREIQRGRRNVTENVNTREPERFLTDRRSQRKTGTRILKYSSSCDIFRGGVGAVNISTNVGLSTVRFLRYAMKKKILGTQKVLSKQNSKLPLPSNTSDVPCDGSSR